MIEIKYCARCTINKEFTCFNKNKARKDGLCTYCRICESSYKKEYFLSKPEKWNAKKIKNKNYNARADIKIKAAKLKKWRRLEIDKLKISGCSLCGYNKCIWALDFHHTDKTTKKFRIATALSELKDLELIKEEIKKCTLICSNCHRELHWKERNNNDK